MVFYNKGSEKKSLLFSSLVVSFIAALIVGLRSLDAGFDTIVYVEYFESLYSVSFFDLFTHYAFNFSTDYLFCFWSYLLAFFQVDASLFLLITAWASVLLFILSLNSCFKNAYWFVFLLFLSYPGYIALFGNAIRQGLAISFVFFTLSSFYNKEYSKSSLFLLTTCLFHNFTGVFLALVLLCYFLIRRLNFVLLFPSLLITQPAILLIHKFIRKFTPSIYVQEISYEYFFHYSFFMALFVLFLSGVFLSKLPKGSIKWLYLYISFIITISALWFSPTVYGRLLYFQYPFIGYFLFLLLNNLQKAGNLLLFVCIFFLYFVGVYYIYSESAFTTLN